MAFELPTLKDLAERTRQSFRANLKGSDAWVWPNNVYASAKVIAGKVFEVFGFAAYIQKQIFAHTAPDIESLLRHGEEFGVPRKPAAPAIGTVVFTGDAGFTVDTNAVLQRVDGVEFRVTAGGTRATAGTLELSVIATTDGAAGNTEAGTPLEITDGVDLATVTAAVGDAMALGADVEGIESYRARILFRKRNPPHGGAPADYVMWAGSVAGVSFYIDRPTVFVERRWNGNGTVRVFPLMFDLYDDGIPQTADLARVSDYIAGVAPAGANVTVAAPVAKPTDIIISGMTPDRTDVREAVLTELRSTFKRLSRVAGVDAQIGGLPYLAYPTSFSRSWIWQAIANATGEERHILIGPTADIPLFPGEMATLGNVTFVP